MIAAAALLSAHVGISDVVFDGLAGRYPVRVVVRIAGVVPGLAQITVRVLEGSPSSVRVQVAPADLGLRASPAPEAMQLASPGSNLYSADLWLMTAGAYQVRLLLDGNEGKGNLIVPITSLATRQLGMPREIGWVLAALGALLAAGALTILRAAVREAVVPAGQPIDDAARRRGRLAVGVGAIVVSAAVAGGWTWWRSEDAAYRRSLDRPLLVSASVARDTLVLRVTDSAWSADRMSPLIPDHGKMMHLFIARAGTLEALAHLHPTYDNARTFTTRLPSLPAGRYHVFGDVVHEDGLARTLTASVAVTESAGASNGVRDADDAWITGAPLATPGAAGPLSSKLAGGGSMSWERAGSLVAGPEMAIRVMVRDAKGNPAVLEPYMGMRGHAIVMRDDGGVFVHLHPAGTISIAAQQRLEAREWGDSAAHAAHDSTVVVEREAGVIRFPFVFPTPGRYRIWVQVRMQGAIHTGVFDTAVEKPPDV